MPLRSVVPQPAKVLVGVLGHGGAGCARNKGGSGDDGEEVGRCHTNM